MWIWVFVAFVVGIILGWIVTSGYYKQQLAECQAKLKSQQASVSEGEQRVKELDARLEQAQAAAEPSDEPEIPITPDDLKKIEGIGPKISQMLQEAGIHTFAQLAAAETHRLQKILDDARLRLADPTTWPEQARLAAAGDWAALAALQDNLKGGRQS